MKMTEKELMEKLGGVVDEKLKPLLEIKEGRPDNPKGDVVEEEKLFPSLGEFVRDVYMRDVNEESAKRVYEYTRKVLSMDSDPSGGVLVPTKYRDKLLYVSPEDAIVRPRAFVIPADSASPDAPLDMPYLEQAENSAGSNGDLYGGIWFGYVNEGDDKPETEFKLGNINYAPVEWAGFTVLTDKLIRNTKGLEAFINLKYKEAEIGFEDNKFLTGTGIGQPLGVINSPACVTITRDTALTVKYVDITAMKAVFLESNNAVWVISRSLYPAIAGLQDGNGNNIFIRGSVSQKLPDSLDGIPIKWTFKVPAKGYTGDIILADFKYYIIKDGYGPAFDKSTHVFFRQNKTCLKMFGNHDGKPWLKGTLTADDNATEISPFVKLTTKLS